MLSIILYLSVVQWVDGITKKTDINYNKSVMVTRFILCEDVYLTYKNSK